LDPFLYVQEEYDNVERALKESLRYDYGPGQTVDYYNECCFRLTNIRAELNRLRSSGAGHTSAVVAQLWDLANRLTLIERSHLGEFSWPFADAIRRIATALLSEDEDLQGKIDPIICQSALNSFQGRASKTFHFVRSVSAVFCAA
jgi:hypothetical protein